MHRVHMKWKKKKTSCNQDFATLEQTGGSDRKEEEGWRKMKMPTLGLFVCMVWFQKLCRGRSIWRKKTFKTIGWTRPYMFRHVQDDTAQKMAKHTKKTRTMKIMCTFSASSGTKKKQNKGKEERNGHQQPLPPVTDINRSGTYDPSGFSLMQHWGRSIWTEISLTDMRPGCGCNNSKDARFVFFRTCSLNFSSFSNCSLWFFSSCSISFWCFMASCRHGDAVNPSD